MTDDNRPTIAEQYLTATNTKRLKLEEHRTTDADKLLAAGYATSGDPERTLALLLWRMRATGDTSGFNQVVDSLVGWVHFSHSRKEILSGKKNKLAIHTVRKTLWWWLNPVCMVCNGRGHPVIPDTPHVDDTRDCEACSGTGQSKLEKLVHHDQRELALRVMDEMNRLSSLVFADMAKRLKKDLDSLQI